MFPLGVLRVLAIVPASSSQVKRHQLGLLKANLKCRRIADNRQDKGGLNIPLFPRESSVRIENAEF